MDISDIHFHDTKIHRVIEDAGAKTLTMEVTYPVDWEQNIFEKRLLIFEDVHHYQVVEWELFGGEPTILRAEVVGTADKWSKLRLDTNAGFRMLNCVSVRLSEYENVA
ncbi:MAG: hypothetical protein R3F13_03615 [Prosthecobacter sp.]